MFKSPIALAQKFTSPVVLSRLTIAGKCSSAIGTFVIVNRDGWIVTAGHIVEHFEKWAKGEQLRRAYEAERANIEADASISARDKKRQILALQKFKSDDTDRSSAWWGRDGVKLVQAMRMPIVDLGIGRLEPFDPAWLSNYPVFKDPMKGVDSGASVCTLGFPFHNITPVWDSAALTFRLPAGALPIPFFPISGIVSRSTNILLVDPNKQPISAPFPLRWIETSYPGLKGQSGGPIIDSQGSVWGIQCNTVSYALGFDPPVPGRKGVTSIFELRTRGAS